MEEEVQETLNKLWDVGTKNNVDVPLLDNVVTAMFQETGNRQRLAEKILVTFKEHPEAWTKVTS